MSGTMRSRWLCVAMVALVACGGNGPEGSMVEDQASAPGVGRAAFGDAAGAPSVAELEVPGADVAAQGPVTVADSAAPVMIIRTGTAEVEVADVQPAVAETRSLVTRLGGYITQATVQVGRAQRREALVVARVPAARFDEAVAGLRPLGVLQQVNVAAQDVGEEYVDLEARVRNRQRLEERLLELLATRTGELEDVLAVERELARVREEIDRQEGRMRYLRNQVALSTLTIMLHEPAPLIATADGQNVFAAALRAAWRNFIGLLAAAIASLGVVLPLAVAGGIGWIAVRRMRRRRRVTPGRTLQEE